MELKQYNIISGILVMTGPAEDTFSALAK
jgi:hypothetical protein